MKCGNCGSEKLTMMVNVTMVIDANDAHRLTKKVINKKSTQLWGASWDNAKIVCGSCGHPEKEYEEKKMKIVMM